MAKAKIVYTCSACAAQFPKWQGQCAGCGQWNTLAEETYSATPAAAENPRLTGYAAASDNKIYDLKDIALDDVARISTGLQELDRVLGGGIVKGGVVLIGGDPGIGKSTILLQTLTNISQQQQTLYVTGEESLQQVSMRAKRLELPADNMRLLTETNVEKIIKAAVKEKPAIMVVDSIQTIFTDYTSSAPGSVSQVRESAAQLVRYAKQSGMALFLVGHVTKEGALAGPRVLEHMVDSVLYFEGDPNSRFRLIRAVKNRFGAVNELGVFAMTEKGLQEVKNPSAIFLARDSKPAPGSTVMVTWEGTRPLLVEVQALVDETHSDNPRRVTVGLEQNRLSMLLAVLNKHASIATYDQDVFVNVVGGLRINETASDLALLCAIVSSLRNRAVPNDTIVFGEVGLGGEIRPVQNGQERLAEAAKHGFKTAIVPTANMPKKAPGGLKVYGVKNLSEAIERLRD
jgi:DNA repair protein RadA/Sms